MFFKKRVGNSRPLLRVFGAGWAAAVLLLCGCAAQGASAKNCLTAPFLLTADYTCGELTGELSLEREDAQSMTLTLLSPAGVAGFSVQVQGDTAVLSQNGIESELPLTRLPARHPARVLAALFCEADAGEAQTRKTGDGMTVHTYGSGASATLCDGVLRRIDIPGADLHLAVTGFDAG